MPVLAEGSKGALPPSIGLPPSLFLPWGSRRSPLLIRLLQPTHAASPARRDRRHRALLGSQRNCWTGSPGPLLIGVASLFMTPRLIEIAPVEVVEDMRGEIAFGRRQPFSASADVLRASVSTSRPSCQHRAANAELAAAFSECARFAFCCRIKAVAAPWLRQWQHAGFVVHPSGFTKCVAGTNQCQWFH